ncbi:sister chromatid cohesion protein Dcc1p [Diutina catenulata]
MDLYNQLASDNSCHYKLIQLPPDLLKAIEAGDDIVIKQSQSEEPQLVMTSNSKTWKVRQMNHSNTVLVMNESDRLNIQPYSSSENAVPPAKSLVGFASCSYEYELTPMKGAIDESLIPVYTEGPVPRKLTIDELMAACAISPAEFAREWSRIGGCDLEGYAVILSPEVVSRVLYLLLTTMIAQQMDYMDAVSVSRLHDLLPNEKTPVVNTVLARFSSPQEGGKVTFDHCAVVKWFGIAKLAEIKGASVKQFLLQWKSSLPEFYNVPLDISDLSGHFFTPQAGLIEYIDRATLSKDTKTRITDLLRVQREWDYDEFVALVKDLVPAGKKPDSVIMKFARKKRVGKKFVVAPR